MADTAVQSIDGWMAQKCKEINRAFKVLQNELAMRQEALLEECDRVAAGKGKGTIIASLDQTALVSAISQFGAGNYKSKKPEVCTAIGR